MDKNIFTLKNKKIIVSGASSDIGVEMIECFLNDGAMIYALVKSEDSWKLLNNKFQDRVTIFQYDLSENKKMIDIPQKLNITKVDNIINCIGMTIDGPIETLDNNEFERIFETNLFSIVNLIKNFSPFMGNGSSILNIASALGVRCIPNSIGYSTSKAALIHFSKCLALEYAVRGIRVNCISPGYFKSDMTKDVINNPVLYRGMLSKIPNHRLLKVEEIIPFIRLVISDAGSYITGANIVIDGGLSCW